MPIYEYKCPEHGKFDMLHRYIEEPRAICPRCGKVSTAVMSAPMNFIGQFPSSDIPVFTHDWKQVDELRNVPATRPPTPPEELVRMGVLPNNADRFEPQMPRRMEKEALAARGMR